MKKLLVVFTYAYPFSPPIEQFFHKEMEYLISNDDMDIWVVTVGRNKMDGSHYENILRECDNNYVLRRRNKYLEILIGTLKCIKELRYILKDVKYLVSTKNTEDIKSTLQQYIQANAMYSSASQLFDKSIISRYNQILLYSYWLGTNSILSCLLKKYKLERMKMPTTVLSRAHGMGDLYFSKDYNYRPALQLFRDEHDFVFPISEDGCELLSRQGMRNVHLFRLGVERKYTIKKRERNRIIVSCSSIDENKRVIDIAKAISLINEDNIQWIHFGGGNKEYELIEWCKKNMPGRISYTISGKTDHNAIMKFYSSYSPALFVNLSRVEGIPVSIMEAFSYGIPALATNVGATHELVNNSYNGYLVEKNYDIQEVSNLIAHHISLADENYYSLRINAEKTWKQNYTDKNFVELKDYLSTI